MPNFIFTLRQEDDPLIQEFAYQIHDIKPPNNAHGIPLRVCDIMEEMRGNIARGMVYEIETDAFDLLKKCRIVDPSDAKHDEDEHTGPQQHPLLGDIDGWKHGRVYDPDVETAEDE